DEITSRWQWVQSLASTADAGMKGKDKVTLEDYVQIAYFDRIIQRSNLRLRFLSDGQYSLVRSQNSNMKSHQALELDVIDHYTGKRRSVRSLSGGESFQASLALALGLSDEVQSQSSGIQIDTMFIDEGFGTLDKEALSQAVTVLEKLSGSGRLIGINFAKSTRTYSEGVGYAIPVDVAEPILSDIANGKTESSDADADAEESGRKETSSIEAGDGNAFLGITCVTISEDYARYYGIPTGAYVSEVNPGSAAEKAGIAEGDIITKVDDTEVTSSSDLKNMISHYSNGDSADLEVITFQTNQDSFGRSTSYERKTVTVTFGTNEDEEKA
ncbi:MAG: PDZ domain-containing protein, partial [Lachnospiraceae bacterium]|nr:PDZ domain-containing protein [Lachnospiraceae bacterium]